MFFASNQGDDTFQWEDGSALDFVVWAPDEPSYRYDGIATPRALVTRKWMPFRDDLRPTKHVHVKEAQYRSVNVVRLEL